jgi:hypothetical protein
VWDIQSRRVPEWSMGYNVYAVELRLDAAGVRFMDESSSVPLAIVEAIIIRDLGL